MELLIVTGLSGAGKSMANKLLEDMGYYAVDNMPCQLFPAFAELCIASQGTIVRYERVAFVTDVRSGCEYSDFLKTIERLKHQGCDCKILFMEARPETILCRYKETRRRHPLMKDDSNLTEALNEEIALLSDIRAAADFVIDTTNLGSTALRKRLNEVLADGTERKMLINIISFGFMHGLPPESDLVFDVRFLKNPFYVKELRNLTGNDQPVVDFLLNVPQTKEFFEKLTNLLNFLIPQYINEGKTGLVISIGCTGGRHRSVAIAQMLRDNLVENGRNVVITHRDTEIA